MFLPNLGYKCNKLVLFRLNMYPNLLLRRRRYMCRYQIKSCHSSFQKGVSNGGKMKTRRTPKRNC